MAVETVITGVRAAVAGRVVKGRMAAEGQAGNARMAAIKAPDDAPVV